MCLIETITYVYPDQSYYTQPYHRLCQNSNAWLPCSKSQRNDLGSREIPFPPPTPTSSFHSNNSSSPSQDKSSSKSSRTTQELLRSSTRSSRSSPHHSKKSSGSRTSTGFFSRVWHAFFRQPERSPRRGSVRSSKSSTPDVPQLRAPEPPSAAKDSAFRNAFAYPVYLEAALEEREGVIRANASKLEDVQAELNRYRQQERQKNKSQPERTQQRHQPQQTQQQQHKQQQQQQQHPQQQQQQHKKQTLPPRDVHNTNPNANAKTPQNPSSPPPALQKSLLRSFAADRRQAAAHISLLESQITELRSMRARADVLLARQAAADGRVARPRAWSVDRV